MMTTNLFAAHGRAHVMPSSSRGFFHRSLLALAMLAAGASLSFAQTILIDFGANGRRTDSDDLGRYWNNVTDGNGGSTATGVFPDLLSIEGEVTPAGLAMIRRFNGANENGTTGAAGEAADYPTTATGDSLYGNTESFNNLTNIYPSFKLTGLDPQQVYRFTFYASRMGVGDNRETGYTVTGTNTGFGTLNAANNVEETAKVGGITPTSAGEITISLAPTENNNNANHFTYLGTLLMEEDDTPTVEPILILKEPEDVTVLQTRPVLFSVQFQGSPPYEIQWSRNGEAIPGATQAEYSIPSASLDLNGSVYSAVVKNAGSTSTSRNAILTVTPDTQAPSLVSSILHDTSTFLLAFDEPLDPAQAANPSGYTATTEEGPLTVEEVELSENRQGVRLVLGQPAAGTLTIAFNGLRDLAGNVIPSEIKATIVVPVPEANSLLFDFGGGSVTNQAAAPHDPINFWNNITAPGEGVAGSSFVTADGTSTEMGLIIVSRFGSVNGDGTRDLSAPFPAQATQDSFFGNTEPFDGRSDLTPIITLTGLDPAMVYDFTFYASRMNVGDNRETRYTVIGANTGFADLNAAANITETAVVTGIRPVDGETGSEITIELTPTENNNNANHFIYLGVMKVTFREASTPGVAPVMLSPVIQDGKITLNWTGSGVLEWSSTLRENDWTPVTPAPTPPYAEDLVPNGNRYFRVIRR